MADITKDNLTPGLALVGIGLAVGIGIVIIGVLIYIIISKNILSIIYFIILNFLRLFFVNNESIIKSDICSIIPSDDPIPRIPSLFTAHVSFFFGFLLSNAIYLYKYKNDDTEDVKNLLNNRKYRAGTSIFLLIIIFLFIMIVRYNTTNCESLSGMLFTIYIFGVVGNLWYKVGEICGLKLTDIFGVSQSIISNTAKAPVVCAEVS